MDTIVTVVNSPVVTPGEVEPRSGVTPRVIPPKDCDGITEGTEGTLGTMEGCTVGWTLTLVVSATSVD